MLFNVTRTAMPSARPSTLPTASLVPTKY
ncbi:Putative protein of unknown function [Podospora comata]|uniref:Uncharacterized protein n=1 Tax=Podospora comata TaxID=48703 RepID=A0ABY6S4R2_PODCO|nr:Putative protein of unknown function [Podospora comata]